MLTFSNFSYPYISNNLLGISQAIQGLPDNINNLITPKNLRDAIYTTWVNNIFKQTTASGSYYVGLDSDNAGNVLTNPFYFGKRNYLGNNVMNSTLLNNGTDVFFFNNKPDSTTQSTIITFLAGNPTLFNTAPYIITSATNSGLDFSVINPNGNVNLTAASNSSIYLNGYQFPSISSTGSIGDSLVLGENNIIKWKTAGSSFTYNNSNPTSIAVGGVPINSTFSNISLNDLLTEMFYPPQPPTCTLSILFNGLVASSIYEVGSITASTAITFKYTINPYTLSPVNFIKLLSPGIGSNTYTSSVNIPTYYSQPTGVTANIIINSNNNLQNTYNFTFSVYDTNNKIGSSLVSINTYFPYYWSRSKTQQNATDFISAIASGLTNSFINGITYSKVVSDSTTNNISSLNNPNNEFLAVAFTTAKNSWASSTIDFGNMIGTYNLTTYTITSPYWSGITYYIYIIGNAITKTSNGYYYT